MIGAARAGLSIMDPDFIPNFPADSNIIHNNLIVDSVDAGIHVQGDNNAITENTIVRSGGYGIYLCGPADNGCYPPGANATSEGNFVEGNIINRSGLGAIGDFGTNTVSN